VKGHRVRLLTITGAGATADVAATADIPVADLQPALLKLVAGWQVAPDEVRFQLRTAGGAVLHPTATLADQGVQDGDVLLLRIGRLTHTDPGAAP
jgi:WXG100 protein secretion system (Wss), protein YukD